MHYYILTLDFSVDLGLITFTPWRLLTIMLSLPLLTGIICLHLLYESPKFLANAGEEKKALEVLAKIYKRNGQSGIYPVKKIIHSGEEGYIKKSGVPFLMSVWIQTSALFRKPLLSKTLHLSFLFTISYGTCSGLYSCFPFLADAFISTSLLKHNTTEGICNVITQYTALKNSDDNNISCKPKSNLTVVFGSIAQGTALCVVNWLIGIFGQRRKLLLLGTMMIPCLTALACATVPNNAVTIVAYFTTFLNIAGVGIVMSYFVDLYPVSQRGTVSSLAIIFTRFSAIISINVVGALIMDHCNITFLLISGYFLCGIIATCFLPSDKEMISK